MFDHSRNTALTVISLSDGIPNAPERRESSRSLSILKAAVLRSSLGEELCMVRNISRGGLMAHIFSDLPVDDAVKIAFRSGVTVRGRVVWRREGLMGVKFGQLVDVGVVLSEGRSEQSGHLPRAPRVEVSVPARLRSGARYQAAALCNISQGGARVSLSQPDLLGEEAGLSVAGLPALVGSVRWRTPAHAGIAFNELIAFEDVGRWISNHNTGRVS